MAALDELFAGKDLVAREIYGRLLDAMRAAGPVVEDAKKTSVHLAAGQGGTAFAGAHPRRAAILLNLRTAAAIESPRVRKVEQVSRNRFHNEILLASPADVDGELARWIGDAYGLARPSDSAARGGAAPPAG
jgi:hypothetical protein